MSNHNEKDLHEAVANLIHRCDGPVTAFVILSRATAEVAGGGNERLYADAAYEALVAHGFMPDHEAERQSGPAINTADWRGRP